MKKTTYPETKEDYEEIYAKNMELHNKRLKRKPNFDVGDVVEYKSGKQGFVLSVDCKEKMILSFYIEHNRFSKLPFKSFFKPEREKLYILPRKQGKQ